MTARITSTGFERLSLSLAETFTISRGSTERVTPLAVSVTDEDGTTGIGAASPSAYYGESTESAEGVLPELLDIVESVGSAHQQQRIERRLAETAPGEAAARAAVSIAVHDLAAKQATEPLYQRFGLDPEAAPRSSYTVAIDDPAAMADRASRAVDAGHEVLKVKLGTDKDRERLTAVREAAPEARIRVDANTDWTPEQAIDNTAWLADLDVEFLEQPVPADDIAGLRRISAEGAVPVAADESCVTASDVPRVADAVDIVVVKLMKCGGIRPATRQIQAAKAHDLSVMLGCMVESSASIAGSAALAPLVEYADLDGALLLAEDRYEGVVESDGRIALSGVSRGTGAVEKES
jgi:L-alanine-DL-glutamate epimerase-like enolase superfamily enzyme